MLAQPQQVDHKKIDRISLWIIGVVAVAVVFGGALQLRATLFHYDRTIVKSFREQFAGIQQQQNDQILGDSEEAQELALLQSQDTDADGLNDFDETYVYVTSPYLTDSDSDGVADNEEIQQNTNPNCPEGQDCEQVRTGGDGTTTAAAEAFDEFKPDDLLNVTGGGSAATRGSASASTVETQAVEELSIEEVRAKLKEYGVTEEVLASTDDETLMKLYQDTLSETGTRASLQQNPVAQVQAEAKKLRALSIQEKRQMLIQAGIDSNDVNALSEEQLNQLFDEAVTRALEEQGIPSENVAESEAPEEEQAEE